MLYHGLNNLLVFAGSKGFHGWSHEIELLLKIVKADRGIDFVPVLHFHVNYSGFDKFTVNSLVK
jgi:hypothetical protein